MANKPTVEIKPSPAELKAAIDKFVASAKDRTVPNRRAAIVLDQWVQENFRSEGGRVGGWTPFRYGGRRIPGGGFDTSAKLLQDTGALRASFHSFADKDEVGIGSEMFYSVFHEFGTGTVPARRMLPHEDDVLATFMSIYNDYFAELAGEFAI